MMKRFVPVLVERLQATRLQLLDVYGTASLNALHAAGADPMVPRIARVTRRRASCADVWTLESIAPDGEPMRVRARPVQHALRLRRRRDTDQHQRRSGRAPDGLVHTDPRRRQGERGADATCRPATRCGLRGPFGHGWPVDGRPMARDVVVVAGGLGLAPLRPAIYRAAAPSATAFGQLVLLYGTRSPEDILFRGELAELAATARHRDRGHGRSRRQRLARPCRRRDAR